MTSADGARLGAAAARRLARLRADEIAPGLTDAEIARVEHDYGLEFADDHRAFLAAGLPFNAKPRVEEAGAYFTWERPWPDWRNGDLEELRVQLDWPVMGILVGVEQHLWHPAWGDRPPEIADALAVARAKLAQVPRLVPVYAHRFLPAGRGTSGHPVLSIWQGGDIIVYGADLDDYIQHEFGRARRAVRDDWQSRAMVPFWSDFLRGGSAGGAPSGPTC